MKLVHRLWRRARFRYRIHRGLGVDLALAVAGVALLWPGQSAAKEIVGIASTIIGSWRFVQGLNERWQRHRRIFVTDNPFYARTLATCEWPAGFELHGATPVEPRSSLLDREALASAAPDATRPYLTDPAVNALLDAARSPLTMDDRPYRISDRLAGYQLHSLGLVAPHDNEDKIGLRTDLTPGLLAENAPVRLQRTDYFSGTATNEMATKRFEMARTGRLGAPIVLADASDAMIERGRLVGLADSDLSNHIGVSTLVLSADDRLMLQHQGAQNVSGGEMGPGGSGSLDVRDLRLAGDPPTLQALCRAGMEREAAEELSARFAERGTATVLTGHARFLLRGGKPEFFGISRSITSCRQMAHGAGEERYVTGIEAEPFEPGAVGLMAAIDRLLGTGRQGPRYGVSLVVCLRLARAWLETAQPDALVRIGLAPQSTKARSIT